MKNLTFGDTLMVHILAKMGDGITGLLRNSYVDLN
jgi:hypothetical protein